MSSVPRTARNYPIIEWRGRSWYEIDDPPIRGGSWYLTRIPGGFEVEFSGERDDDRDVRLVHVPQSDIHRAHLDAARLRTLICWARLYIEHSISGADKRIVRDACCIKAVIRKQGRGKDWIGQTDSR